MNKLCECGCRKEVTKPKNRFKQGHNPTSSRGWSKFHTSEIQSRRRHNQLKTEENLANELRKQGWEVFSPTVVCDRIGIKHNKVFFIEFKKEGQELKEGQRKIKNLMENNYKIVYHK